MLFFAHGPTATGKSSKLEAIRGVLGDYAATADFETFLKRHGDAGIRNDVARLAGARLVISVEVDDGKALAEGLLKLLTGGDTVAARFLYRETFEFRPVFKLWLAANERPTRQRRRRRDVATDPAAPVRQRDPRSRTRRTRQARAPHRPRRPNRDPRLGSPGLPRMAGARPRRPAHACATTPPHTAPKKTRSATGSPTAAETDPTAWTPPPTLPRELRDVVRGQRRTAHRRTKKLGTLLDAKGYPDEKSGGTRGRRRGIRVI